MCGAADESDHGDVDKLRRKITVRSNGQQLVLVKRREESAEHVIQKALLWAMLLPDYPELRVEVPLPRPIRYKPDLLALDAAEEPLLWGECGEVSVEKLRFLLTRFRRTRFVFSKWNTRLEPFASLIEGALPKRPTALPGRPGPRDAPVELICFPAVAADWIAPDGEVLIDRQALETRRWEA